MQRQFQRMTELTGTVSTLTDLRYNLTVPSGGLLKPGRDSHRSHIRDKSRCSFGHWVWDGKREKGASDQGAPLTAPWIRLADASMVQEKWSESDTSITPFHVIAIKETWNRGKLQ